MITERSMNIIVTAGGTSEPIDNVRRIANTGTGRLGSLVADELAEALSRRALTPQFGLGGVPMEVAEKVLGMSRKTIMDLMERGELDIGIITTAQKKRGTRVYRNSYISPKKFYELTGYIWEGEKKE